MKVWTVWEWTETFFKIFYDGWCMGGHMIKAPSNWYSNVCTGHSVWIWGHFSMSRTCPGHSHLSHQQRNQIYDLLEDLLRFSDRFNCLPLKESRNVKPISTLSSVISVMFVSNIGVFSGWIQHKYTSVCCTGNVSLLLQMGPIMYPQRFYRSLWSMRKTVLYKFFSLFYKCWSDVFLCKYKRGNNKYISKSKLDFKQ